VVVGLGEVVRRVVRFEVPGRLGSVVEEGYSLVLALRLEVVVEEQEEEQSVDYSFVLVSPSSSSWQG
jgi:hypothetical protein